MPKLPLDREMLKLLPGVAIDAVRHPRRTASQVVNGSINVVGQLLERRQTTDSAPATAVPPPVIAGPRGVEDTVEDLAPDEPDDAYAEPVAAPDDTYAEPVAAPDDTYAEPVAAPDDTYAEPVAAPDDTYAEPVAAPDDTDAEPVETPEEDEGPADVHPEGPAPHMRPRIAGDVERDYEEDIPGITGHRER